MRLRNEITVNMDFLRKTVRHHIDIHASYNALISDLCLSKKINPDTGVPFFNVSEMCMFLRRTTNSDPSRIAKVKEILKTHKKAIIFYNFNFELEMLRKMCTECGIKNAEWNGEHHDPLPVGDAWVYLVQYTAGAEGWNCITCDTVIFYSQSYSYKQMEQAAGRIDRLTTPFQDLYYYHIISSAPIDIAIRRTLDRKETFNELDWMPFNNKKCANKTPLLIEE